jgi:hypothetical protein
MCERKCIGIEIEPRICRRAGKGMVAKLWPSRYLFAFIAIPGSPGKDSYSTKYAIQPGDVSGEWEKGWKSDESTRAPGLGRREESVPKIQHVYCRSLRIKGAITQRINGLLEFGQEDEKHKYWSECIRTLEVGRRGAFSIDFDQKSKMVSLAQRLF